jgi:DnaJ-class molecular chaperone
MAKRKQLYDVLGVPRDATDQQIRKAFRDLARKYHPDHNPGDKQAEERFKEVNRASEVLLNKEKRELYDEFGEIGLREGFDASSYRNWNARRAGQAAAGQGGQGFGGLEDIFEQMRRGGGRAEGGGGFADFFGSDIFGGAGRGGRGGRGPVAQPADAVADIEIEWLEAVLGTEKELAVSAGGAEPRTLRVRIPAGVRDEGQVRLRGQSPDGGDIVLRIHVKQHPLYRRIEDDLELTLPVTVGEAFHGAKIQVPTPYGSVQLRIPKGVRGGSRMRLKGKGVRRGDKAGDLFVDIQIVLPPSDRAAEAIDSLETLYEGSVRAELDAAGISTGPAPQSST